MPSHDVQVILAVQDDDLTFISYCDQCGRQEYWFPVKHLGMIAKLFHETAEREGALAGTTQYTLQVTTGAGDTPDDAAIIEALADALRRRRQTQDN